jgi:AcrR family transcriptional regulator
MADLLGHAGVNSGSFYHFFESKEALLRAVLEEYLHALRPMVVQPAFARTDEPVRAYLRSWQATASEFYRQTASTDARSAASPWKLTPTTVPRTS